MRWQAMSTCSASHETADILTLPRTLYAVRVSGDMGTWVRKLSQPPILHNKTPHRRGYPVNVPSPRGDDITYCADAAYRATQGAGGRRTPLPLRSGQMRPWATGRASSRASKHEGLGLVLPLRAGEFSGHWNHPENPPRVWPPSHRCDFPGIRKRRKWPVACRPGGVRPLTPSEEFRNQLLTPETAASRCAPHKPSAGGGRTSESTTISNIVFSQLRHDSELPLGACCKPFAPTCVDGL